MKLLLAILIATAGVFALAPTSAEANGCYSPRGGYYSSGYRQPSYHYQQRQPRYHQQPHYSHRSSYRQPHYSYRGYRGCR